MKVTIRPVEGIYKDGSFDFLINIPPNYKNDPPQVKCVTKHLHPNIQATDGSVCMNLLREDWLPSLGLDDILVGLLHLYQEPNPSDPLNTDAADLMRSDLAEFTRQARSSCGLC
jgi:ubiquitin-conjugating enzyme E2 M